jgi:hypothetical protein
MLVSTTRSRRWAPPLTGDTALPVSIAGFLDHVRTGKGVSYPTPSAAIGGAPEVLRAYLVQRWTRLQTPLPLADHFPGCAPALADGGGRGRGAAARRGPSRVVKRGAEGAAAAEGGVRHHRPTKLDGPGREELTVDEPDQPLAGVLSGSARFAGRRQSGQAAFRSWECPAQPNRSHTATRPRQVLFQPSPAKPKDHHESTGLDLTAAEPVHLGTSAMMRSDAP